MNTEISGSEMDIVIIGWVGLSGTTRLFSAYRERVKKRFPEHLLEQLGSQESAFGTLLTIPKNRGIRYHIELCDESIMDGFWRLKCEGVRGYEIEIDLLPMMQMCIEVCEYLEKDLMEMDSSGCSIVVCDEGPGLVKDVQSQGINAVLCGKTCNNNDAVLVGTERRIYVTPPYRRK